MENLITSQTDSYNFSNMNTPAPTTMTSSYEKILCGKVKGYRCTVPDCGKTFKYISEVARHSITHSDQRPYFCTFEGCDKSFKRMDSLEIHIRSHTGIKPFACEFPGCDFQTSTKSKLYYHSTKHERAKQYKCSYPDCNKSFSNKAHLKQHENALFFHMRLAKKQDILVEPTKLVKSNPLSLENQQVKKIKPHLDKISPNTNEAMNSFPSTSDDSESQEDLHSILEKLRKENELLKKALQIQCDLSTHIKKLRTFNDPVPSKNDDLPSQSLNRNVMLDEQEHIFLDFFKEKEASNMIDTKYSWNCFNLESFDIN